MFVTAQVRRTTEFGPQLNPKQVRRTTAGMKQTWLQVELHNEMLKWMLASAIKCCSEVSDGTTPRISHVDQRQTWREGSDLENL